ncbi:MAG: hypothetical protein M3384_21260 [Acidobacteriota bacterium]|nr:hypothetical protein [Acidobacteriota bacterium]
MNNSYFKYYQPTFLLTLLVGLAIVLYLGFLHWGISVSIITVISFLLLLIDKFLWKYKPFSYLFWVKDFSGRYEGYLEYEFRDENCEIRRGRLKHVKIIHQTASIIKISSFTFDTENHPSSASESIEVAVAKGEHDVFTLIYTYRNDGNPKLGFAPHYGTEVIKVIEKNEKKCLSGDYYTNRTPIQTRGKFIDLEFTSNNLEHPF